MSKLYDIAKKTIDSNSMIEAEQILFGEDGIILNSSEYYKNIISNFIQKKEIIIKKENGEDGKTQLVFDLNNCNDLWNILFIYNYYIRYIEEKIELLNQQIKQYVIIQGTIKSEINKLNPTDITYQEKRNELNELSSNLNKLRQLKQNYEIYKTKSLQQNIVELENMSNVDENGLKEYIEKLKEAINCIQKMRDSLAHANKNLSIDSIVSINNPKNKFEISIPIEYLEGFNKGRIIVHEEDKKLVQQTNDISLPLLEALDFDMKKIDSFFYNVDPNYLDFILEKVNYDINELYKLSPNIFIYKEKTMLFFNNGIDLFTISKLPRYVFRYLEKVAMLYKLNIDVTKLPENAFWNVKRTISFYKAKIDIYNLPKCAFDYPLKTLKLLMKADIDIYNLPLFANLYPEEIINSVNEMKNYNIDTTRLPSETLLYSENIIKLHKMNIDIYNLPEGALIHADSTLKLLQMNIDIYRLPKSAFHFCDKTIKLYEAKIDIYNLHDYAFEHPEKTIKLYQNNLDIYNLPHYAFLNPEETIKLYQNNIDIYKVSRYAFRQPEKIISLLHSNIDIYRLPINSLRFPENIIKLYEANLDIYNLPERSFYFPKRAIMLRNANIDIYNLPDNAFDCVTKTIELFNANLDIYKLPNKCFSRNTSVLNLKIILEKLDYEKLDSLPLEFFECNPDLLDEMFQRYNLNISKSIFGINNPKIIATLIYANNVLSNFNQNISTFDMDIQPYSIIGNTFIDNFNYRKNIEENVGKPFTSQDYIEQFKLADENNIVSSNDEVRKTILTKIRNASEHFRFKPVKDNDGNILEDKIYIYDEDNRGVNNFNLIIDLRDLIGIIREVEKQIEITQNQTINDKKR